MNSETMLMATLICYPESFADLVGKVTAEDFERPAYGEIFASMARVSIKSPVFDIVVIRNDLEAFGRLAAAGGESMLMELAAMMPASTIPAQEHAQEVVEAAARRRVVQGLKTALEATGDGKIPLHELAGMVESIAIDASTSRKTKDLAPISSYMGQVFKVIEAQTRGEILGLKTGFRDIDEHTGGFQKTDLVILGGRPGMGKTSLALEMAVNACIEGKTAAFFELEMAAWQVVQRAIYQRSKVDSQLIKRGRLPARDWPIIKLRTGELKDIKLFLDDSTGTTPLQVLSKCRRLKAKHGLDLVVIDNVQIMKGDGRYGGNRRQELADVSNSLKRIAKDLEAPVIAISHLNRESARSSDPTPSLHDLKETGDLEQDADIVILLHMDSHYKDVDPADENTMKVIFAKFREGDTGMKLIRFNKQFTSFENMSQREEEPPQRRINHADWTP